MDALSLFALVLAACVLGGTIGGCIAYSLCRQYYGWMATRTIAVAWRTIADIKKDA